MVLETPMKKSSCVSTAIQIGSGERRPFVGVTEVLRGEAGPQPAHPAAPVARNIAIDALLDLIAGIEQARAADSADPAVRVAQRCGSLGPPAEVSGALGALTAAAAVVRPFMPRSPEA